MLGGQRVRLPATVAPRHLDGKPKPRTRTIRTRTHEIHHHVWWRSWRAQSCLDNSEASLHEHNQKPVTSVHTKLMAMRFWPA